MILIYFLDENLCSDVVCQRGDHTCKVVGDEFDLVAKCVCITVEDCQNEFKNLVSSFWLFKTKVLKLQNQHYLYF